MRDARLFERLPDDVLLCVCKVCVAPFDAESVVDPSAFDGDLVSDVEFVDVAVFLLNVALLEDEPLRLTVWVSDDDAGAGDADVVLERDASLFDSVDEDDLLAVRSVCVAAFDTEFVAEPSSFDGEIVSEADLISDGVRLLYVSLKEAVPLALFVGDVVLDNEDVFVVVLLAASTRTNIIVSSVISKWTRRTNLWRLWEWLWCAIILWEHIMCPCWHMFSIC